MAKKVSTNDLKKMCKLIGAELEVDNECQCYRAIAPQGQRFDAGLHELVAVFGDGFIGNGMTKAEAREDLAYCLRGYVALEPCDKHCAGSGAACESMKLWS